MRRQPEGLPGVRHQMVRTARRRGEAGVSIVLVLLVFFVLTVVLFQVTFSAEVELSQARSMVDSARMGMLADAAFVQAQSVLLLDIDQPDDAAGGDAAGGGAPGGGAAGSGGNPLGDAGGAGADGSGDGGDSGGVDGGSGSDEAASIADTTASTDSLLDEWADSSALAPALGQDYTLFVEIEDEDGKLNLLGLWTPDEEQRATQREAVRRVLDKAFEGTSRDLSFVDATDVLDQLDDWVAGNRGSFDPVPVPKRKQSNEAEEASEGGLDVSALDAEKTNYPLTLGELLLLDKVAPEHLYGFVEDDTFHPGLDRYLTLLSNFEMKPKPKTEEDAFGGSPFTQGSLFDKPSPGSGTSDAGGTGASGAAGDGTGEDAGDTADEDETFNSTNDGLINANSAPLIVLRAIAPDDIPTSYLEKVIDFRNEIVRLKEEGALDEGGNSLFGTTAGASGNSNSQGGGASGGADSGDSESAGSGAGGSDSGSTGFGKDAEGNDDIVQYVFTTPDEVVDKVEQKYLLSLNLEPGLKSDFTSLLTTTSQVFTVKILIYDPAVKRRASYRGVVWRLQGSADPRMLTVLPLEPYYDARRLRDYPVDLDDQDYAQERFTRAEEAAAR